MKFNIFVKCGIAVFMIAVTVATVKLQFDGNRLKAENAQLAEEIEAAENELAELNNLKSAPLNSDRIIELAREKLNMRLPEEIVFYNDLLK